MATVTKRKRKQPEATVVAGALALARQVRKLPDTKLWLDYDRDADGLYISLRRPQDATDTVDLVGERMLLRYRGKDLVGITVLDASKR